MVDNKRKIVVTLNVGDCVKIAGVPVTVVSQAQVETTVGDWDAIRDYARSINSVGGHSAASPGPCGSDNCAEGPSAASPGPCGSDGCSASPCCRKISSEAAESLRRSLLSAGGYKECAADLSDEPNGFVVSMNLSPEDVKLYLERLAAAERLAVGIGTFVVSPGFDGEGVGEIELVG